MKIERKKEIDRVKITHNKKLLWIIIFMLAVLIFLVVFIKRIPEDTSNTSPTFCMTDSDCVADSCCHAKGCVNTDHKPACNSIMCTQECAPNTLDCGGACKCLDLKCEAAIKK